MSWYFLILLMMNYQGMEIEVRVKVEVDTVLECHFVRGKTLKYFDAAEVGECQKAPPSRSPAG